MTRFRLSRIFWIGAAGILIVAALVAVAAILRGDFGDTDAKILGSLFTLLLAGATAVSGLALVERGQLELFGWAATVVSALCFVVIGAAIWSEFDDDELTYWAIRAIVLLIALLLIATQRLLLRAGSLTWIAASTAVSAALATLVTWAAIGANDASGAWQGAAIFWILTALGFLLLPVLQRFQATGPSPSSAASSAGASPAVASSATAERVLAELDGVELVVTHSGHGLDVQLVSGERLMLRRRP